jgi:hypothetical protein
VRLGLGLCERLSRLLHWILPEPAPNARVSVFQAVFRDGMPVSSLRRRATSDGFSFRDLPRCVAGGSDDVAASLSDVLQRGGLRRDRAQSSASPHRYRATAPKRRYGGPPPRVALVASVGVAIGKPAAVSAAAVSRRRNSASGVSGIIVQTSRKESLRVTNGSIREHGQGSYIRQNKCPPEARWV